MEFKVGRYYRNKIDGRIIKITQISPLWVHSISYPERSAYMLNTTWKKFFEKKYEHVEIEDIVLELCG